MDIGVHPRAKLVRASIALLALLAAGGCSVSGNYTASPVVPAQLSPYALEVETLAGPAYDNDGYDVSLGFALTSDGEFDYNAVVQEIVQEVVYERYDGRQIRETLTLVEAFELRRVGVNEQGKVVYRLPSFQRDRHFERGYLSVGPMVKTIDVWRVVRCYPAFVEGTDATAWGFAHLPQNRNGTMKTLIPPNFNESHQRNHNTQGRIVQDDRKQARWYHLRYHWYREPTGQRPQADFELLKGSRPKDESAWVSTTINSSDREASAGE